MAGQTPPVLFVLMILHLLVKTENELLSHVCDGVSIHLYVHNYRDITKLCGNEVVNINTPLNVGRSLSLLEFENKFL